MRTRRRPPSAHAIAIPLLLSSKRTFRELTSSWTSSGIDAIDGVLFDLGVSSMQFDDAERGFSFREDGAAGHAHESAAGRSAYDMLATASESELADIFFHYGQERAARSIARVIVATPHCRARLPTTTHGVRRA